VTNELGETFASIRRWYDAAVQAVDPASAVRRYLEVGPDGLNIGRRRLPLRGRLYVAAIGKAALGMAVGASEIAGERIAHGLIITKDGHLEGSVPPRFEAYEASHPIPDERGTGATEELLRLLSETNSEDVVLALISGGGSALMEAPVDGVSLQDVATTTDLLLRAGAPIHDLNAVRVPLSRVKGGRLRLAVPNAKFATLLLSDVLGNDPRVIASGPTVSTAFTPEGAVVLLKRYGVFDRVPDSVRAALILGREAWNEELFAGDIVQIVGDNAIALEAFAEAVRDDGRRVCVSWQAKQGEARALAKEWVEHLESISSDIDLVLGGGEATVTVRGDGRGGRNTEFALAAGLELERRDETGWVIASLATDGQDALTGVAGAIVSSKTISECCAVGIDPVAALEQNDSLTIFETVGGSFVPGPTGTNVNDIYIALRAG